MPPLTVSHPALLVAGSDQSFREALYLMVLAFGRLLTCREAFGRTIALTGSQFAVLIGTAYRQNTDGVSIRALADHVQLASTHVTTEVGRLIRKGLLSKRANERDRRGVLVRLTPAGEAALIELAPFLRRVNDLSVPERLAQGVRHGREVPHNFRAEHRICACGNPPQQTRARRSAHTPESGSVFGKDHAQTKRVHSRVRRD